MIDQTAFIHYGSICFSFAIPGLGVALGQGIVTQSIIQAINRQPALRDTFSRFFFIAIALTETASVLSALIGITIFMNGVPSFEGALIELGIALGMGIPAGAIGILSARPTFQAFQSIARQPQLGQKILNLLLISQSIIQTPVIFALVVGWILNQYVDTPVTTIEALKLCSAGLTLALGSIGSIIGLTSFASEACRGCGQNSHAYPHLLSFSFLSQAVIETPVLFSLVTALLMIFAPIPTTQASILGIGYICAAFASGMSSTSTGISSGHTAQSAAATIAIYPQEYATISRISILGQTLIDTTAIYGLIIAVLIIFSL